MRPNIRAQKIDIHQGDHFGDKVHNGDNIHNEVNFHSAIDSTANAWAKTIIVGRFRFVLEPLSKTDINYKFNYRWKAVVTDTQTEKQKIDYFDTSIGAARWFTLLIASRTKRTGEQEGL